MLDLQDTGCRAARSSIDTYTSGELPEPARGGVVRHLDACAPCAEAFADAARLRLLVRRAVRAEPVPDRLGRNIRALIGKSRQS